PRMRILVPEPAARDQHAGVNQCLDDSLIGVAFCALVREHALALEPECMRGEATITVYRVRNDKADILRDQLVLRAGPYFEILSTVPGRGLNKSRPGIVADVVCFKQRYWKIITGIELLERVIANDLRQHTRRHVLRFRVSRDARLMKHIGRQ